MRIRPASGSSYLLASIATALSVPDVASAMAGAGSSPATVSPVSWAILAIAAAILVAMVLYIVRNGRRHRSELERLANADPLTGISNRPHVTRQSQAALDRCAEMKMPITFVLVDIDHFKAINREGGHVAGDAALKSLTGVLRSVVRKSDIIGRWGGEDFLVVLPSLGATDAAIVIERMRTAAAGLERPLRFSAGVATAALGERDFEALITRADDALYAAKRGGRNRIVIAPLADQSSDSLSRDEAFAGA